jgi:hypothetical protein
VSDFVLDASLALQWFLEDEADRKYSLGVLASLSEKRALVPILWFYEVGNGRQRPVDGPSPEANIPGPGRGLPDKTQSPSH